MRIRLLLVAAVTLTVGFSGSTSESRARPDPPTLARFGLGIYTTMAPITRASPTSGSTP
jgi:hypothetical protein